MSDTHRIYINRTHVFDKGVTWTTVAGLYPHAYVPNESYEAILSERDALSARLAEVEAERETLTTSGIIEVAVRNPSVMEYMKHWEARANAAEAALATARADAAKEVHAFASENGWHPSNVTKLVTRILALSPQEKPHDR